MTQPANGRITLESPAPGYVQATISNPPINLADPEFFADLREVLDVLEADDETRVLVFESSTPDYFIAHFDVVKGAEMEHPVGPTGLPLIPDLTTRMARAPFATIAKIRGRARGFGSEFLLACDMRFASREQAVMSQIEVGFGLWPGGGGTERLPHIVGRSRALEIVLSSEDMDGELAERYGYVNRTLPDAELDAFVDRLARRIASFDRPAVAKAKELINHSSPLPAGEDLVAAQDAFFAGFAWDGLQRRLGQVFEMGFQQAGDTEYRLGEVIGELGAGK
jgi:enoyl-CoA hydratase/carnithine racemase